MFHLLVRPTIHRRLDAIHCPLSTVHCRRQAAATHSLHPPASPGSLEPLHWNAATKTFCDYGRHCNKGTYVPHVVVKCASADGAQQTEHLAKMQDLQAKNPKCPATHPKYLFPLGDGAGGLMQREKFVPVVTKSQFVEHTGYVSLFPLFLHTLPPDSPLLGSLLDLLEDKNKWVVLCVRFSLV